MEDVFDLVIEGSSIESSSNTRIQNALFTRWKTNQINDSVGLRYALLNVLRNKSPIMDKILPEQMLSHARIVYEDRILN